MMRAMTACAVLTLVSGSSMEDSVAARPAGLTGRDRLGCSRVGVLLPGGDYRFATIDAPLLMVKIQAATGVPVDLVFGESANGAPVAYDALAGFEHAQAAALLHRGACILVVTSSSAERARATVLMAKARGVPVIAYDRLIQAPELSFYVGFDNRAVGQLQAQYIVDHRAEYAGCPNAAGGNLALLHGDGGDPNAQLFRDGAMEKLQPLIDDGTLNPVYDAFTPYWDVNLAMSAIQDLLAVTSNQLHVVYSANDDMAHASLNGLTEQGLNGRVLVTGQDASPAGIVNIIRGNQAMTVFKPIDRLAQATADLIAAMRSGADVTALTHGATTDTRAGAQIPSVLVPPQAVDRCNVRDTVLSWFPEDVCAMLPAGLCDPDRLPGGTQLCEAAQPPLPPETLPCPAAPLDMPVVDRSDYGLDTCWYNGCVHNCRAYPKAVEQVEQEGQLVVVPKADLFCLSNADTDEKGYQDRSILLAVEKMPKDGIGIVAAWGEVGESRAVPYTEEVTLPVVGPGLAVEDGYCYRTIAQVVLSNGYAVPEDFGPFTCFPPDP